MNEPVGLRERKKARTHRAISDAAIALFLSRGYDAVPVADIAEAAEVSKRTLFAYFPTKDALVLHRFADHETEAAEVVRARASGESPLDALHRHRRAALERRDPITGLCDLPELVAFYRLILTTPALAAALLGYVARQQDTLTEALQEVVDEPLAARLAACQIVAVTQQLARANQARIVEGRSADALFPEAMAENDRAFELLRTGLAPYR